MNFGPISNSTQRSLLTEAGSLLAKRAVSYFHAIPSLLLNGYSKVNQSLQGRVLQIVESHIVKHHGAALLIVSSLLITLAARRALKMINEFLITAMTAIREVPLLKQELSQKTSLIDNLLASFKALNEELTRVNQVNASLRDQISSLSKALEDKQIEAEEFQASASLASNNLKDKITECEDRRVQYQNLSVECETLRKLLPESKKHSMRARLFG